MKIYVYISTIQKNTLDFRPITNINLKVIIIKVNTLIIHDMIGYLCKAFYVVTV